MKYLPRLALSAALFVVTIGLNSLSIGAENQGWITLPCDGSLESWQGNGQGWTVAREVALAVDFPTHLIAKSGNGILVNLLHEVDLLHEVSEFNNLTSKQLFGDIEARIEFLIPADSNGGVKFQGLYEIQICDSHGKGNLAADDCGGVYPRAELEPRYRLIDKGFPPQTNAAKPAGQWQALEVMFQSPRFAVDGKKTRNARFLRVVLNDQLIHENVELQWPTGYAWRIKDEVAQGPLLLQGDHGPIAYRNIRVRPLGRVGDRKHE